MKTNKLDLILYIKSGNLSWGLYLIASLIILIPVSIVLVTDVPFSSAFSKTSISVAIIFVMIGKTLTILNKKKGDKSIPVDIGILIGMLITLVSHVLK